MAFSKSDLEHMKEMARLQAEMEGNGLKYISVIKEIGELNQTQAYMKKELLAMEAEEAALTAKMAASGYVINATDRLRVKALKDMVKETKELVAQQEEYKEELIDSVKEASKLKVVMNSTLKLLDASSKQIAKGFKKGFAAIASDNPVTAMSKQINQSGLAMGFTADKTKAMSKHLQTAYHHNSALGVGVGELAKMQASYSDEIGRGGVLTENSLQAMMQLSKMPGLGADGASQMAAEMDNFGMSVAATRDLVEETTQSSGEMGLNSGKVVKVMQKNMRLAQRYHFKGGVKGLASMAKAATKLKMNMDSIGSMADKAFRIEGAVEMAAKLQTMGGAMAKLGDPFKLMFKARNDFEGFAKDIGNATKEFAKFDETTGEFEISGYQLDRMREISEITGIGVEDLAKMGKEAAKFERIESLIPPMNISDDDMALISSIAEFDKKTGKYMVTIDGQKEELDNLNEAMVKLAKGEKKNLDARIKDSKTFDESWSDLVMQLKTFLLPVLEGLSGTLTPILQDVMKQFGDNAGGLMEFGAELGKDIGAAVKAIADLVNNKEFVDGMVDFAKSVGGFIKMIAKFVAANPKLTAALIGLTFIAGPIMKLISAIKLLKSFTSGLSSLGGGSAAGGVMGRAAGGTSGAMRAGGGIGMLGAIGSMGVDYGREKEVFGKKGSNSDKWAGVGSSALAWGGTGAMIGSIIPGVGTAIGAGVGAGLGGMYGAMNEFGGQQVQDAQIDKDGGLVVSGPKGSYQLDENDDLKAGTDLNGRNQDSGMVGRQEISFDDKSSMLLASAISSQDTSQIVNGKPIASDVINPMVSGGILGGLIDGGKTKENQDNSNGTKKIEVTHSDMIWKGSMVLTNSNGQTVDLELLKSGEFQREMTKIVHEQTNTMLSGGKPKPSTTT